MNEKMIRDAYCRIREIDNTIPDDVLDFMKDSAIEKLNLLKILANTKLTNSDCCGRCNGIHDICIHDTRFEEEDNLPEELK